MNYTVLGSEKSKYNASQSISSWCIDLLIRCCIECLIVNIP